MKLQKAGSVLLLALALSTSGCAAWWANFQKDPVTQTEAIIQSIGTIVHVAGVVFGGVKPVLSSDKQALAQRKFDEASLAVDRGIVAVRAAVQAAADAKQANPDFTKVLADLSNAVTALQGVIDETRQLAVVPGASLGGGLVTPPGYDSLVSQVSGVKARIATRSAF